MKRMKSGIIGFDELIGKGIPKNAVVLVSGAAGTGKTIFTLQYLAEGARNGERGLYITFEETDHTVVEQAAQFDWEFKKLVKQGKIKVVNVSTRTFGALLQGMKDALDGFKPKRVAIDSMTTFCLYAHSLNKLVSLESIPVEERFGLDRLMETPLEWDGPAMRRLILEFIRLLQNHDSTSVVTSELPMDSSWLSRDTVSEFLCDGVILLQATSMGRDVQRTLEVKKMRNTKTEGGVHAFDFTKKGIVLQK